MKINPNDKILANTHTEKIDKKEKPSGKAFGAILSERIENASKAGVETAKPTPINTLSEIQLNSFFPAKETPTIDRVEKLLDILDEYQNKLGNPQATLKDIYPLITKMEAGREQLLPLLDSIADGDGLKDILNQALTTSSLEIIKFNRGDYLNP